MRYSGCRTKGRGNARNGREDSKEDSMTALLLELIADPRKGLRGSGLYIHVACGVFDDSAPAGFGRLSA